MCTYYIEVTWETSHVPNGWLNAVAPLNMLLEGAGRVEMRCVEMVCAGVCRRRGSGRRCIL